MTDQVIKDGYVRIVWEDSVIWHIDSPTDDCGFVVARFPFVPDYYLCDWIDDEEAECERPIQQFKTLAEALAVLRVLDANTKGES
jgi:hypothetical protein